MFKKFFNNLTRKLFKGHDDKPKGTPAPAPKKAEVPKVTEKDKPEVQLKVNRRNRRFQGDRNTSWVSRSPFLSWLVRGKQVRRRNGTLANNPPGSKRVPPTLMPPFDGRYLKDPGSFIVGRKQRGGYGRRAA